MFPHRPCFNGFNLKIRTPTNRSLFALHRHFLSFLPFRPHRVRVQQFFQFLLCPKSPEHRWRYHPIRILLPAKPSKGTFSFGRTLSPEQVRKLPLLGHTRHWCPTFW